MTQEGHLTFKYGSTKFTLTDEVNLRMLNFNLVQPCSTLFNLVQPCSDIEIGKYLTNHSIHEMHRRNETMTMIVYLYVRDGGRETERRETERRGESDERQREERQRERDRGE